MRKPAFDKIFDPNDPERQERMWQQYRTIAILLMVLACGGYFLLVPEPGAVPVPGAAAPAAPAHELLEQNDVLSFSGEVQIGNEISSGLTTLTLVETIEVQADPRKPSRGFTVGIPKRIATAAGNEIQLAEPKISIIMLNQLQIEENLMESGSVWWRIRLGPQSNPLPPGQHSYDVLANIEGVNLFSPSGGGSITFPVVPPSTARVERAQAAILLPDYVVPSAIAARAWIAKADHDSVLGTRGEEISGALSVRAAAGLSKERRAVSFVAPRGLEPEEGIWIQASW